MDIFDEELEEKALTEFVDKFGSAFYASLDKDGKRYDAAMEYVMDSGVDPNDEDALFDLADAINKKMDAVFEEFRIAKRENRIEEAEKLSAIFTNLQLVSQGMIGVMLDQGRIDQSSCDA